MRSKLVISRHWDNPKIAVTIDNEGIALKMLVDDFFKVLAAEIGNPTFIMTEASLVKKMKEAMPKIESKIKETSSHG